MKTKKLSKAKINNGIFNAVIYILLLLLAVIMLYPLIFVLSASFSDPKAVAGGEMLLLPVKPSLEGYRYLMQYKEIWVGYGNTIFYMIAGTLLNLAATLPCAYAMSRKDLKGRKYLMIYFMITMYFSGGLIPTYLVVAKMGLLNSVWSLILPGGVAVFNVIVARTFFESSIPEELYEAAAIDGSSNMRTFFKIALPLSKPILAVMVIFTMVAYWNDWFTALIYMSEKSKYPLQLALRQVLIQSQATATMIGNMDGGYAEANKITELIKFASIVVGSVPMLIAYPFVQKYFEKGFMAGAVKG